MSKITIPKDTEARRGNKIQTRLQAVQAIKIIPDLLQEAIKHAGYKRPHLRLRAIELCEQILDYRVMDMSERRKLHQAINHLEAGARLWAIAVLQTVDPTKTVFEFVNMARAKR